MNPVKEKESIVSVVIPIYNGQRYIEETVRSVLSQTYANLEVLCIIDGTRDNSINMIKRFSDSRIKIVEQENRGATHTRNRGLSMAIGEYILFLDQDDVIKPEFIEAAVREIVRTNSTGVAVNGHLINSQGRIIRRMYRVNKPKLTLKALLKGNEMYTPSQMLMKREPLVLNGGFDVLADQADDWDMWIRHAGSGKLVFLDRYLIGYRMHDANQSLNLDKMLRSELHIVDRKLIGMGNQKSIKSYSYMRYSKRAANWGALGKALQLNLALLLKFRFYWTVCQIVWTRIRSVARSG